MKVKEIVSQYQKDIDLVNRIDPQTRQISTFIAAGIADDNAAFEMIKYLAEQGLSVLGNIFIRGQYQIQRLNQADRNLLYCKRWQGQST
jgi:hypothetical protein